MRKVITLTLLLSLSLFASSAEELISSNGCLSCHAVASKKSAPAFAGIAKRNLRFEGDGAKEVIKSSIKNGSKGKYPRFSDTSMPPYPNLSNSDLEKIADYILSQASKAKGRGGHGNGMGKGGGMGRGGGMGSW
jgi:cytochrome c